MEFLKDILGDELYAQVAEKLNGSAVKLADISGGAYVGKGKYDALNEQFKAATESLAERDKQLNALKDVKPDEMRAEIERLKQTNADTQKAADEKIAAMQFDSTLTTALVAAKARNPKAVAALLSREALKLNGDKIEGLDDQLKALRTENSFLFADEPDPKGGSPINGGGGKLGMNDILRGA